LPETQNKTTDNLARQSRNHRPDKEEHEKTKGEKAKKQKLPFSIFRVSCFRVPLVIDKNLRGAPRN
jgi:hypothetical protein